jgi:hypothetical protein
MRAVRSFALESNPCTALRCAKKEERYIMNYVTREIMEKCKVDADTALKIQYEMDCSGLDYSECSQRAFNACMKECFKLVAQQQKAAA